MTTAIIYTCDRCGVHPKGRNENGGQPPLWIVTIGCAPIDNQREYLGMVHQQRAEFCNTCLVELSIKKPLLRAETKEKPPSIEDMIRAIVREEKESE